MKLKVGDRVMLRRPVERFPHFTAPAGATGEVVHTDDQLLSVRLDENLRGAEEWDNEVQWTNDDLALAEYDLQVIGSYQYAIVLDESYDAVVLRDLLRREADRSLTKAAGAGTARAREKNTQRYLMLTKYAARFEHIRAQESERIARHLRLSQG